MAKHLIITGIVQGVGYRAGFMHQARALKLSGWVRNRSDGSVEAIVCGNMLSLQAIIDWAWLGPPNAQVRNVAVTEADDALVTAGKFEMQATQ